MSLAFSTRLKLRNVLAQIEQLLNAETPFENVPFALRQLRHAVNQYEAKLDKAMRLNDDETIHAVAENVNPKILEILPILGFIVRSTNVRNAFELLEPLGQISTALLGARSKLMISSEWDYIPFAIPIGTDDLPSFTFIGLPVSEAANILIVPLAGHEIGHAVWRKKRLDGAVSTTVEFHVDSYFRANEARYRDQNPRYADENDLLSRQDRLSSIEISVDYAVAQAEEYFCDLMGLALFGHGYVRAFAYILAPGMGGRRDPKYPTQRNRAENLVHYAEKRGVHIPAGFVDQFNRHSPSGPPLDFKIA